MLGTGETEQEPTSVFRIFILYAGSYSYPKPPKLPNNPSLERGNKVDFSDLVASSLYLKGKASYGQFYNAKHAYYGQGWLETTETV